MSLPSLPEPHPIRATWDQLDDSIKQQLLAEAERLGIPGPVYSAQAEITKANLTHKVKDLTN